MRKREILVINRRGFLAFWSVFLPGIALVSPRRLYARKEELKLLYHALQSESLQRILPKRNTSLVLREVGVDRYALYKKRELSPHYALNSVGKTIWDACDGNNSIHEISEIVHQRYRVSFERSVEDCSSFLREMLAIGVIQP